MNEREILIAQAEVLEHFAKWVDQPDRPTPGLVGSFDLLMRAAALRAQADVLEEDE